MKQTFKRIKNELFTKIVYIMICVSAFLYVFAVATFSERNFQKLTFLNYGIYLIYFALIALSCFVALYYLVMRVRIKITPYTLFIPIFVLFSLIGTIISSKDFRGWITLVLLSVSFFVFYYAFRVMKKKGTISLIILSALFCFTVFYLAYYGKQILDFKGFFSGKNRLGTDFDNQNGVATMAAITFGFSLYSFVSAKTKIRFVFALPAFTSFWVGITTGSRTFIIVAYVLFSIFFAFFFSKHKVIYFSSLIIVTVAGLLTFNHFFDNRLLEAFKTLNGTAVRADAATLSRELYMDYGFLLGARNVIFGLGVNGFKVLSGVGTYAHNNFAEVLCDFGILGIVLFYLPLLIFIVRCFKCKKIDRVFLFTFCIYFFIASFSNVLYYKKIYYIVLTFMYYLAFEEPFNLKEIAKVNQVNKITFVCDSMQSGGAEKVIASLANEMAKNSIDITIIGVGDIKPPKSFYFLDESIKYINFSNEKKKRVNGIKRIWLLRNQFKIIKPNVVISFLPNANIYACLSLFGLGIPHIVSERNNPKVDPKGRITRIFKKLSFYLADGCVFQTGDARAYYKRIKDDKVTVIKNPIVLYSKPIVKNVTREKVVLTVGRLTEQKNYYCLLKAFKLFNRKNENEYQLRIYGDGPLKNELHDYCRKIQIENYVHFMGNDPLWHKKEQLDSMFVLSSNYEGMPNSLAEAMALGIPSISTDSPIGGSRELIKDEINGFLVPINDYEKLAKRMDEIIKKSNLDFSENNKMMYIDFSPKTISSLWISFAKSLKKEVYE